ncbi:MAG TPA: hypothetical protein PLC82_13715 [Smithellaceae bacterium]|nr:hypothetical protein [Smithellaceae bacterium]
MEMDGSLIERDYLIFEEAIKTSKLMRDYPPRFFHNFKKILYDIAACGASLNNGLGNKPGQRESAIKVFDDPEITITRWRAMQLPLMFPPKNSATEYLMRKDVFNYNNEFGKKPGHFEWYLNFADTDLFMGYGGSLMAQDELQVAEHPALASIREMLLNKSEKDPDFEPCTRDINGNPTPYLIRGVERRLSIAINANAKEGRPDGLYGNKFASVSEDAIGKACKPIIPPTITHLIAMEAPSRGKNEYTLAQITDIFTTAYTAFMAAKHVGSHFLHADSMRILDTPSRIPESVVTIHTGNWGTGAYGGNKIIMALLQLAAARAAYIDRLVYHTFSNEYSIAYEEALDLLSHKLIPGKKRITTPSFLKQVQALRFKWGVSDGN